MAWTSSNVFVGVFFLAGVYAPTLAKDIVTETGADIVRDSRATVDGNFAEGAIYVASKQNQPIGSRSGVAPNVKPIRTPGQCFRRCLRLKGTTEGFCYASCY